MALNSYLSLVTLNINGLNAPIKRHRVSDWIKKQDPSICCLQETHFDPKTPLDLKWGGGKAFIMLMDIKKCWCGNPYIRQIRF